MRFLKEIVPLAFLLFASKAMSQRTMVIQNNCAHPVNVVTTSGAIAGSCSSCPAGSTCNTANNICYLNPPSASNGLNLAAGAQSTLTFPDYGREIIWSGNLDGCNPNLNTACSTTMGNPTTKAEFTIQRTSIDYYDVEVINGHSIPVAMYPQTTGFNAADPYFCGSPGAPTPTTATGSCSWNFSPPSVHYNWVAPGGASCTSQSDCGSGLTCGLSNNVGVAQRFKLTCGQKLGYWTANQVCGIQPDFGAPFNCNNQLSGQNAGKTKWNLMACNNGVPSCYQDGATNNCCGCANWGSFGISVPSNTQQCKSSNPDWVTYVQPTLQWLKQGCPTAYTYPYDDMSSTFTCKLTSNGLNKVPYNIVFCPSASASSAVYLKPQPNTGLCMDILANNVTDGAAVQIYTCNGSGAQKFSLTSGNDINLVGTTKCIDVPSNNRVNGNLLQIWECNGSGAQKWEKVSTGTNFALRLIGSTFCIDIPSANAVSGQRLQIYSCNQTPAQNWLSVSA